MDCEVKVFPLLVKRQSATWPEFGQRVAQWVDPEKAISLGRVDEFWRNDVFGIPELNQT